MPFETPARPSVSMERVTLYLPRVVVGALNAHAKALGVRPHDLVREVLAKAAGNPSTELDQAVDQLTAQAQAPHVAPKVLDDEGKPIREVMNKLTVEDVAAMDDATIRVLYRELRHFRDTMPEAADDAIFERFQHMPDPE